jgi:hypothetical protein
LRRSLRRKQQDRLPAEPPQEGIFVGAAPALGRRSCTGAAGQPGRQSCIGPAASSPSELHRPRRQLTVRAAPAPPPARHQSCTGPATSSTVCIGAAASSAAAPRQEALQPSPPHRDRAASPNRCACAARGAPRPSSMPSRSAFEYGLPRVFRNPHALPTPFTTTSKCNYAEMPNKKMRCKQFSFPMIHSRTGARGQNATGGLLTRRRCATA